METPLGMIKRLVDGNRLRVVVALMEHDGLCVCPLTEMRAFRTEVCRVSCKPVD